MKLEHVAIALLYNDKKEILVALRDGDRHYAGFWEFVGGKLENNEFPNEALKRELKEEIGLDVELADMQEVTFSSHQYPEKKVILYLYGINIEAKDFQCLEHKKLKWISFKDLKNLKTFPANQTFFNSIRNFLDFA